MFIDMILPESRRSRKSVSIVVKSSMIIHAMPKEESIAPMNVPMFLMKNLKQGFVHIVENLLKLIHPLQLFVVRGNVELHGLKQKYGQQELNFFVNVFNVEKNFGESYLMSRNLVESFVHANVKLIRKDFQIKLNQVFMGLVYGCKHVSVLLSGIINLVKYAGSMAVISMFTILNIRGLVVTKMMIIWLHYVRVVIAKFILTGKVGPKVTHAHCSFQPVCQ